MNPRRRVLLVRRVAITAVVVALALAVVALFIGLPVPGIGVTVALNVAVVAAILWLVLFLVDRRAASAHDEQGRSWRPNDAR